MANETIQDTDWLADDYEGQLAIDVYQTEDDILIKAPIAGVQPEDLEVSVTDDSVTIKGQRQDEHAQGRDNYYCQECYWGSFTRSYIFPVTVDADKAEASLKNGVLTVKVPKFEKSRARSVQVISHDQ